MSSRYATSLRNLGLALVGCQCPVLTKPCDECAERIAKRDKILQRLRETKWLDYHKPGGAGA